MLEFLRIMAMMFHRSILYGMMLFSGTFIFQKVEKIELRNAFHLCWTTTTTIGYGAVIARSDAGRVLIMLYAIVGIPLFLFCMASYGSLLNLCILKLIKCIEGCFVAGKRVSYMNAKIAFVSFWLVVIELFVGTFIVRSIENERKFSLLESSYAWFSSIATVGYGDIALDYPPDRRFVDTIILMISEATCWTTIASLIQAVRKMIAEINNSQRGICAIVFCCFGDNRKDDFYALNHHRATDETKRNLMPDNSVQVYKEI